MQNMSFHVLDKICKFCGVVVAVAKTRHSRELYIWERKRVQVLSARGLVHCFRPCLGAHLICSLSLKKASFARIILVFHVFSRKKSIRVTAAMKLYMDDTLEEDVCMIFDELEVQNSPLKISSSWRRLLFKMSLSTGSRQRVSRLRYLLRTTTDADCANKLVLLFILDLGSKALKYR